MIFISKVFTMLLLPPGCFVVGLLFIFLIVPGRFKFLVGLLTIMLYSFSIQPVSDYLLRPLEDAYPPLTVDAFPDGELPQVIVVLGGGTIQASPEATSPEAGHDTLIADATKRAVYAFTLSNVYPVPVVFSGGRIFDYDQESEAAVAGRLFDSLGLPTELFIPESESRNTWENARETAKLGIESAILVTSAYHIKRSVLCFESNGITVIPAPTDYKIDRNREYGFFSFLPSMWFFNNTWLALHEYIGLIYYRLVYHKLDL
ncbi:MAG: YdcF family protein [Treponema sp.]|jgi:uncharacterized SAM-binding protein YcdF (DUF218 family)|nr:YdcF family protein [Treponema sp.]